MSFFGDAFEHGADMLHGVLGNDTKAVTYTPPATTATPSPAAQTLTKPIIGDTKKVEPDESKDSGNVMYVSLPITFRYSEVSRLSNKGTITIDGVNYPMLNMVVDEDTDQVHCDLDHVNRTNVSKPNFIRAV